VTDTVNEQIAANLIKHHNDAKTGSEQYNRIANNYRDAVRKIREPVWNTLAKTLASEMQELGQIEMDFIASTIENAIPLAKPLTLNRPERSTVTSAIENQPVAGIWVSL